MSFDRLLIWGAGGHGKVVLDAALMCGFRNITLLDDEPSESSVRGHEVMLARTALSSFPAGTRFVAAVGPNATRARLFQRALAAGWKPASIIHPSSIVSSAAAVGEGSVILARAVINPDASIGRNCIVNTGAIIEHDCRIFEHVHISPAAVLGGGAVVEDYAHVGIGATVLPKARIRSAAVIGAGSVVLREVPSGVTVAGVPARELIPTHV